MKYDKTTLPANVKAAISDSSYSTLKKQFAKTYKTMKGAVLPASLVVAIARFIIFIRSGFDINDVRPLDAVTKSKTPTLFIHGDEDSVIDPLMCSRLYEAAKCDKQYCMILGSGHIRGVVTDPANYWGKIRSFLSKTDF